MAELLSPPLLVESVEGGKRRELQRDVLVSVRGQTICAPCGFRTDYSSLPIGTRNIVDWRKVDVAGVIHDWIFETGCIDSLWEANLIWKDIAQSGEHKANWLQAQIAWTGLLAGSWVSWNAYRSGKRIKNIDIGYLKEMAVEGGQKIGGINK